MRHKIKVAIPANSPYLKYQHDRPPRIFPSRSKSHKIVFTHALLERILINVDMRTVLNCLRVSRMVRNMIDTSIHLQRHLWKVHMPADINDRLLEKPYRTNPHHIDPLIATVRTKLDLFFKVKEDEGVYEILWMPIDDAHFKVFMRRADASWRNMLVMRSAQRGAKWRIGYYSYRWGKMYYHEMGVWGTPPTFNEVLMAKDRLMNSIVPNARGPR